VSTLLCVPILVHDVDAALRDARSAKDLGGDLVEFRIDELFHGTEAPDADRTDSYETRQVLRLVAESPLPCIVTCRTAAEGGSYDGPEDARISLFERLGTAFGPGEHPPRYVDVELATYLRSANIRQKVNLAIEHPEQVRDLQTSLIISTHDFAGRPPDLTRRVLAMRQTPAKVLKVAYLARSLRDNIELFDLLIERDRPMIALAMGEFGLASRILAPKFNGFLTFASLRPAEVTAPGQPTIHDLLHLYRFRAITPTSAVYGVVGWPVSHSLSPHLHNAGFEAVGHDGVYLPLPVAPGFESLKATLGELIDHAPLGLRGVSVTLPHKENLVRLARERSWALDQTAAAIGAANTLTIERDTDGRARACHVQNTDVPAFLDALREGLGELAGRRAAVLGAGGVGKAAAYALATSGARVTIFNRDRARAEHVASTLGELGLGEVDAAELASFDGGPFDILVNATPLGMKGGPDPGSSVVPAETLRNCPPGAAVADTVYTPVRTPLLEAAEAAGLRTVDGVSMFVRQASLQFSGWTGKAAPTGLFSRIVREAAGSSG
jgi:3-dehydroquinate dehydratase / shikimate dehydrogenase